VSGQGDKGKFSTDIGNDVIEAALKSVARAKVAGPVAEAPATAEHVDNESDSQTEEYSVDVEAPVTGPSPTEVEGLRLQLELSQQKGREMMDKVKDSHERMLRASADLDNFKKRAQREKEEVQRFGIEKLLKDFLPVIDNLDRALEHAKASTDVESFRQGVAITRKLFEDTLSKHGVKGFTAVGQPFDPRFHEAMSQVETAELPPQHVVFEAIRGYLLNDRLIRPALVTVSQAPTAAKPTEAPEASNSESVSPPAPDAEGVPKVGE
jgi:molecular chaperone GrpE